MSNYKKPYTIHGNTIHPSNGECFTNYSLKAALNALKRNPEFSQKRFREDRNKKRKKSFQKHNIQDKII